MSYISLEFQERGWAFLQLELKTADVFLQTARMENRDPLVRSRNRMHARVAYDTVLRYLERLPSAADQQVEGKAGLALLKRELMDLGETFS